MPPLEIIIVFAPLVGALIGGLLQKQIGNIAAQTVTTALLLVSAALSVVVFVGVLFGDAPDRVTFLANWIEIGSFKGDWALKIDSLSAVMLVVVTSVSSLVHIYSWGYMADEPHRARFFSYLSFFTFAMLMLVTADNFLQMFFGWEGVGVASYLLIGFWYKKASANDAAIKAFVVNRVGDFGFALGIMAVYLVFGTINFAEVFAKLNTLSGATFAVGSMSFPAIEVIACLLFIGAMGKSAQFLLHTWLPDAMEGPTPVSALIHAATMVTAGVFLVCRCSPIFELAPFAKTIITYIGGITAIFAATCGLAQNDIKRVIAYSTCSQLGYMFFAAGIGAYQAAMFHLFTHAFFKALLFLGAGSVIHGMHHEQDMRKMGGLSKYLPLTYLMMLIGTIALTGVGIPGTQIGLSGFFSKDAIIESAYAASGHFAPAQFAFWIGVSAAFLTSFYSWRLIFMTFNGRSRADHHTLDHAHESPMIMLVPLFVLALGAIAAGLVFHHHFLSPGVSHFWGGAIANGDNGAWIEHAHHVPLWVKWTPFGVTLAGFLIAVYVYLLNEGLGKKIADGGGPIHAFLSHKWYFDEIYHFVFVRGAKVLGDFLWKGIDQNVIDRFGPNGVAAIARFGARRMGAVQTGFVFHYAFWMLAAAVAVGAFVLWRMLRGQG